jgi:hypothetical protein
VATFAIILYAGNEIVPFGEKLFSIPVSALWLNYHLCPTGALLLRYSCYPFIATWDTTSQETWDSPLKGSETSVPFDAPVG